MGYFYSCLIRAQHKGQERRKKTAQCFASCLQISPLALFILRAIRPSIQYWANHRSTCDCERSSLAFILIYKIYYKTIYNWLKCTQNMFIFVYITILSKRFKDGLDPQPQMAVVWLGFRTKISWKQGKFLQIKINNLKKSDIYSQLSKQKKKNKSKHYGVSSSCM